ncbi:Alpha-1,3-mannosyltransferase-like protein, partial [Coemansia sp. RSA 2673]
RKKDIGLAITAFSKCCKTLLAKKNDAESATSTSRCCLVLAGGWDPRVLENTQYLNELDTQARQLGLCTRTVAPRGANKDVYALRPGGAVSATAMFDDESGHNSEFGEGEALSERLASIDVLFLPSFTENQRAYLLSIARCVVYTPTNEHLGIAPLESMYMRVPVVAADSGGPLETIQHGKTGYLCAPVEDEFAMAISRLLNMDDDKWKAMGGAGHERVRLAYSLDVFGSRLEQLIVGMFQRPARASMVMGVLLVGFIVSTVCLSLLFTWWK